MLDAIEGEVEGGLSEDAVSGGDGEKMGKVKKAKKMKKTKGSE